MKLFYIISFIIFINTNALGEYRVYQYYVKSKNKFSMDQNAYLVTSTLNPNAYISYHGGQETLETDMLRSWMCYANTAEQPICPPPLESIGDIVEN